MKIQEFLKELQERHIRFVDCRFTDLRGVWHHMTFSLREVSDSLISEGICFDGSSIQGWCPIHHSDMILRPHLPRCKQEIILDPFTSDPTVILVCDVFDPQTQRAYDRDPRSIAVRAEQFLSSTQIADQAFFGPEAEFFIFDRVRYQSGYHHAFYDIDSDEFPHNNAGDHTRDHSLDHGHRFQAKGGYFPVMPLDGLHDMRSEMLNTLEEMGIVVEKHHHEVAPAQHELGIKYHSLVRSADALQIYKYVVKNVAQCHGKTATFMPKPLYGDNGSGMHVHQSLWLKGQPLFSGQEHAGLSKTALHYIGGILKHAKSLNAFTNPTTNSYKRLVPGFEAPVILAYSASNRSASCRIPLSQPHARRVEVRFPDGTANPYLAFSAMLMAGLDGVIHEIDPGSPQDIDLFEDHEAAAHLPTACGSLREALESLQQDHAYLMSGGVFSQDMIQAYIDLKWREVHDLEHRPHPVEFQYAYSL